MPHDMAWRPALGLRVLLLVLKSWLSQVPDLSLQRMASLGRCPRCEGGFNFWIYGSRQGGRQGPSCLSPSCPAGFRSVCGSLPSRGAVVRKVEGAPSRLGLPAPARRGGSTQPESGNAGSDARAFAGESRTSSVFASRCSLHSPSPRLELRSSRNPAAGVCFPENLASRSQENTASHR